jgi:type IV secretory pathway TrbF-like protein
LLEWREIESDYENKTLGETRYKALITVIEVTPTQEDQYREDPLNPFGLYITSISWTKEI